MQGISSKALNLGNPENERFKFQNQEFNNDLGVDYYEFRYRYADPQLGRFFQIDPLSDKYVYNSTYAFSENKVINGVELEGLEVVTLSGNIDYMLLLFGASYQGGVAFGPDGVALFATVGPRVGIGFQGGISGVMAFYPEMTSVQQLSGTGTEVGVSGGFLAEFGFSIVESSGVWGEAVSGGFGGGFQLSYSKTQTVVSKTLTWKDVGDFLGGQSSEKAIESVKGQILTSLDNSNTKLLDQIGDLSKKMNEKKEAIKKLSETKQIEDAAKEIEVLGAKMDKLSNDIKSIEKAKAQIQNIKAN